MPLTNQWLPSGHSIVVVHKEGGLGFGLLHESHLPIALCQLKLDDKVASGKSCRKLFNVIY